MTISFASPRYGPNDEEFLGSLRDELADLHPVYDRLVGRRSSLVRLSGFLLPRRRAAHCVPSSSPDPPGFSLSRTISVPRPSLRTLYWLKALNRLRA